MKEKIISHTGFFTLCAFLMALPFSFSTALAESDETESKKSFYITPAYSVLKENNNFVETYLTTSVTLIAANATSGFVTFPGIQVPAVSAELDYDDFDGGALVFGWNFANQFSLELHLGQPRILGVSFDIPAQTVDLSNFIDPDTLELIGNTDPGEVEYAGVIGHLVDFEFLELAIGGNYTFALHEKYKLYMGVGFLKYIEIDTEIIPQDGINPDVVESDFDSETEFYFQAGFLYHIKDNFDASFDIKQISAETTMTITNIEVTTDGSSGTTAESGDLVTEFDISGVIYHFGLRYMF